MILFRNQYKKANDNIKVDEELLEKTIATAFAGTKKKKVHYYRPITSVAAAVILVVGVSVAYPELTKKPVTETTIIETENISSGEMSFSPVVTPQVVSEPTPAAKSKINEMSKETSDSATAPEMQQGEPDVNDVVETLPVTQPEETTLPDAAPAIVRMVEEDIPAAYDYESEQADEFTQVYGYSLSDGTQVYKYESGDDKSFIVFVTQSPDESMSGIHFSKDGKTYILQSGNMTVEELTIAYENLEF